MIICVANCNYKLIVSSKRVKYKKIFITHTSPEWSKYVMFVVFLLKYLLVDTLNNIEVIYVIDVDIYICEKNIC